MARSLMLSLLGGLAATAVGCGTPAMVATAPAPLARAAAVSTTTYPPAIVQEMASFDTNRDGTLSQTEYVNGRYAQMRFFMAPTAAETATVKAGLAQTFAKLDVNHDGKLTIAEFVRDF